MRLSQNQDDATIAEVLRHSPLEALDTRILVGHALGLSRTQLITQADRKLTLAEAQAVGALFARRIGGEPIAYITGRREFYGLDFTVTPDVLIPRPETELLVDLALDRLPQGGRVLDMGTGSGAIAVAIAHARPDARVTALDLSPAALAIARDNAGRLLAGRKNTVSLLQSDWFDALDDRDPFDLVVSNPPYVAADDPHLAQGDLRFEPVGALTDRADGLSAFRSIADGVGRHLVPAGWLLLEHGFDQAEAVRNLLIKKGFTQVQSWRDLAGLERVSGGRMAKL